MYFTQRKTMKRAEELNVRRFTDMQAITPLDAMDVPSEGVHTAVPEVVEGFKLDLNEFFVGRDRYLWVRKTLAIPAARDGHRVVGCFDFGTTGGGFNSKFEGLLFVNGSPEQAVDTFHNSVFLDKYAGETVTRRCRV